MSKENMDLINKTVVELLTPVRGKSVELSNSPYVAVNVLLNLGVEVIARGLSIIKEDERMLPFIGAITAIVEQANLHSAHIDMNIVLQDIMKKK